MPDQSAPRPGHPVLVGSAAQPWPRPGCRCRACRDPQASGSAGAAAARSALRVGPVLVDGEHAGVVRWGAGAPIAVGVGDALEAAGVRVIGLPGANGSVALVVGSASGTVLWSPHPGVLPEATLEALHGADLTVAVLALAGAGDDPDTDPDPCAGADPELGGPLALAHSLAGLRRAHALAEDCDVVAIGVSHRMPPARLQPLLHTWGARTAPDGAVLGPAASLRRGSLPARTLVLGAASSGKSATAEALLAAEAQVDYLPTGAAPTAADPDWAARVAAHRRRRPAWWSTLEVADLSQELSKPGPPLLVDSVGSWVTDALDRCGAWHDAPGWRERFDREAAAVVRAWRQADRRVVAVGEETGWGVVPATAAGRLFRDLVGRVNRQLAQESERVLLVVAGRTIELTDGSCGV